MCDVICEQQEEEKRKQKIEMWESMQQGKSYKGTTKLPQVSLIICYFVFNSFNMRPSLTLDRAIQVFTFATVALLHARHTGEVTGGWKLTK